MRVLLGVHGFPPRAHGGTELYAEAHARALVAAHGDTVLVLAREDDRARPEFEVREEARDGYRVAWVNHTFRESTSIEDAWRAPRVARAVASVLDVFVPEVAHVHHLTCLSTLLPSMLAARGVPVVFTLHDYWLMCHRGQLLDADLRRCDGPGESGCARCLAGTIPVPAGAIGAAAVRSLRLVDRASPRIGAALRAAARAGTAAVAGDHAGLLASAARTRHVRENVLPHVDLFLAPCEHMRDTFVRFGVVPERIRVSPYGLEPIRTAPRPPGRGAPLRVGYVGSLMVSKAPHVAMEAVSQLPPGTATLDVFGAVAAYHGDTGYATEIGRWMSHPAVVVHGPLEHAEVPAALDSLDVLVVPSIWNENSPFVILEAFRAGVPVVASRVGGIPELVENEVNGLLVEPGDPGVLAAALARLAADRACLARMRERIPPVRSIADAVREMRTEYDLLVRSAHGPGPGRHAGSRPATSPRSAIGSVAAVVLHYDAPDETAIALRALRASEPPLDRVIVVDNDEIPGDLDLGVTGLPVECLVTGRNLGFPGGMNAGIRAALTAGADAVLLVNNDVIVPPIALAALAGALDADRRRGVAAPIVLARDRPDRIASAGIRFDRVTGRMRNTGGDVFAPSRADEWRAVDAVNGAVMLVAREVFERVGLLDEDYFFSFEEIDFCLRARDAGFESGVTGRAVAYHLGSGTLAAASPRRFYFAARNHLRLASRVGAPAGRLARTGRAGLIVALNLAHAAVAPGGRRLERLAATSHGVADFLRGRFGADDLETRNQR